MKASELEPGMVIDGWTVTTTSGRVVVFNDQPVGDDVVLLEIERDIEPTVLPESRRTWYRADEEVEVER